MKVGELCSGDWCKIDVGMDRYRTFIMTDGAALSSGELELVDADSGAVTYFPGDMPCTGVEKPHWDDNSQ